MSLFITLKIIFSETQKPIYACVGHVLPGPNTEKMSKIKEVTCLKSYFIKISERPCILDNLTIPKQTKINKQTN